MQSWFKYSIAFFALVVLLTGFIYVLGPASTRQAAQSGQSPVGQLGPNSTLTSAGEAPATASGTTLPPATVGDGQIDTNKPTLNKEGNRTTAPAGETAK